MLCCITSSFLCLDATDFTSLRHGVQPGCMPGMAAMGRGSMANMLDLRFHLQEAFVVSAHDYLTWQLALFIALRQG